MGADYEVEVEFVRDLSVVFAQMPRRLQTRSLGHVDAARASAPFPFAEPYHYVDALFGYSALLNALLSVFGETIAAFVISVFSCHFGM